MRTPTVQIQRPDGKMVTINENQLKFYVGRPGYKCSGFDKKTSDGEQPENQDEQCTPLDGSTADSGINAVHDANAAALDINTVSSSDINDLQVD